MAEDEIDHEIEIERVLQNYEDIHDPPPDYDSIIPYTFDEAKSFPKVKITISPGINSADTFQEAFTRKANLSNSFSKTLKYTNNSMEITNIPLKTEIKLLTTMNDNQIDDEEKSALLLEEKYRKTCKDQEDLIDTYKSLNLFIITLLNDFEYIHSNQNLNFVNKKSQIEKLIKSNVLQFKTLILKIKMKSFESIYLEKLRQEIHKFLKIRYEVLYHYMKDFYDIQVEDFHKV
jgi:hypothetical protein